MATVPRWAQVAVRLTPSRHAPASASGWPLPVPMPLTPGRAKSSAAALLRLGLKERSLSPH